MSCTWHAIVCVCVSECQSVSQYVGVAMEATVSGVTYFLFDIATTMLSVD